ncbi:hypothetical protein BJ965_000662 [Streptomyces luteogriseus]|uniref:Uncharacterized protein n=1 Tax=Streptomyces luteogriseus TaxID=68233 RepID=A0A7W7GH89_9ACTN|nr:hypothetical protein [Streptomyces luteogriseus]
MAWLGEATVFPQAVGLRATWDKDLAREVATAQSSAARRRLSKQCRGRHRRTSATCEQRSSPRTFEPRSGPYPAVRSLWRSELFKLVKLHLSRVPPADEEPASPSPAQRFSDRTHAALPTDSGDIGILWNLNKAAVGATRSFPQRLTRRPAGSASVRTPPNLQTPTHALKPGKDLASPPDKASAKSASGQQESCQSHPQTATPWIANRTGLSRPAVWTPSGKQVEDSENSPTVLRPAATKA